MISERRIALATPSVNVLPTALKNVFGCDAIREAIREGARRTPYDASVTGRSLSSYSRIDWCDKPDEGKRIFAHPWCARWEAKLNAPDPREGDTLECVRCGETLPLQRGLL